ncbi:MAG: HNH endonuclease [Cyanothece sp. SIO1E1]|nr:HNH endonuclease [Cyanothece sp. SIO1E1]
MPMNRQLYPHDWEAIALAIKRQANWQCQQCCRPCKRPDQTWLDFKRFLKQMGLWSLIERPFKRGRFVLTVAHLDHQPANCDPANLRAWCSVCHLRYDTRAMATKKRLKREVLGQLRLERVLDE